MQLQGLNSEGFESYLIFTVADITTNILTSGTIWGVHMLRGNYYFILST